jgi:hypothetical protein
MEKFDVAVIGAGMAVINEKWILLCSYLAPNNV